MKRIGIVLAFVLAACSHSSKPAEKPAPRAATSATPKYEGYGETHTQKEAPTMPVPPTTEPVEPVAPTARGTSPAVPPTATPKSTDVFGGTTAPTPSMTPEPKVAKAELLSMKDGSSMGTVTFAEDGNGQIEISGDFTGLAKKSMHAIYIHENGDCSNKGKNVGAHLNPTKSKHGPPASSTRHAGDFGNVTADDTGNATFAMETDSITLDGANPDSVIGRAVVLHAKKDSKSGYAGAPIACGVVHIEGGEGE